jgi:hypothetical protein
MQVSGQLHAQAALTPVEQPVFIGLGAGQAPEQVWMQ